MIRTRSVLLVAVHFAVFGTASAQESQPTADVASVIVGRANYPRADLAAQYVELCELLVRNPSTRFPRMLISELASCRDLSDDPLRDIDALRAAVANPSLDGFVRQYFREILGRRLNALDRSGETEEHCRGDGVVRRFKVAGPFGFESILLHDVEFPPEAEIRGMDVGEIAWKETTIEPFNFSFAPRLRLPDRNGVVYFATEIGVEKSDEYALTFSCPGAFKAWLNGGEIAAFDPRKQRGADRVAVAGRLEAGKHRLLVKLSGASIQSTAAREIEHSVRISRKNGENAEGIAFSNGPWTANPAADDAPVFAEVSSPLFSFPRDGDRRGFTRDELLLLALDYDQLNLTEEAWEIMEKLEAGLAEDFDPVTATVVAQFVAKLPLLPEAVRRERARSIMEKVLAKDPDFIPAILYFVDISRRQSKDEEAAQRLRDALARHPDSAALMMALMTGFGQSRWEGDLDLIVQQGLKAGAPRLSFLRHEASRYLRTGNIEKFDETIAKATALTEEYGGREDRRFERAVERGDVAEARAAALVLDARRESALRKIDRKILIETAALRAREEGALDRVLALFEERAASSHGDVTPLHDKARLLLEVGRPDDARSVYRRILAIEPDDAEAFHACDDRKKERDALMAEFAVDPDRALAECRALDLPEYKSASSVMVLDQSIVVVEKSGWIDREVHQIILINDKNAVQRFSEASVDGDILALRTIFPDGRSAEPVGTDSTTLPGLKPGCAIEIKYRVQSFAQPGEPRIAGRFFFQDTDVAAGAPYHLTRAVYLLPKDTDLVFDLSRAGFEPKVSDRDDAKLWVFERNRMMPLSAEPAMPASEELISKIELATNEQWNASRRIALNEAMLMRMTASRPTAAVVRATEKVVAGKSGDSEKIRAVYDWVMQEIVGQSRDSVPDVVLATKAGNRTYLLAAMLEAAGITIMPIGAPFSGDPTAPIDWRRLSNDDFVVPLLLAKPSDGPEIVLQSSSRWLPCGRLSSILEGQTAFAADFSGGRFITLPKVDEWTDESTISIEMIESGAEARVETLLAMDIGAPLKDQWTKLPEARRKQVGDQLGATFFRGFRPKVTGFRAENFDSRERRMAFKLDAMIDRPIAKSADGTIALKPIFQPMRMVQSFTGGLSERKYPLLVARSVRQRTVVEFIPGPDFEIAILPTPAQLNHDLGSYRLVYERIPDGIRVCRELEIATGRIPPDRYAEFVKFCRSIDELEGSRIPVTERGGQRKR